MDYFQRMRNENELSKAIALLDEGLASGVLSRDDPQVAIAKAVLHWALGDEAEGKAFAQNLAITAKIIIVKKEILENWDKDSITTTE